MTIHETLKQVFGFDEFREGQESVIRAILDGNSALAVFPTGSGKSLCYQLSALHLEGLTLVVSPLIALMKDQIDFLRTRQIPAARLDSSIELAERRQTDADLESGRLKLLYVAPERFSNERFLHKLRRLPIALMVIDEAHCISEWGHNFRPDYLKLARAARALGIQRVLALTATATPEVSVDICQEFEIEPEAFIHTGFHRPNLFLRVLPCAAAERTAMLLRRLRESPAGATIVYVTLQKTAELLADALEKGGLAARAYHAGMETPEREAVQNWFMGSPRAIVVATIAFGMGIDKADIRAVYHYNLPKSLENYSQEIGRAGRDGLPSTCELLACSDDVTVLENFTYGDTPEPASVEAMVDYVLKQSGEWSVSTYDFARTHDVRPLVVNTLFTYLELAEVIEATAAFYSEYQFQPLRTSAEILARLDPERAAFIRGIFKCAKKAKTWFNIDLIETAERLQTTRERLVKAFTWLEEQGDLTLKVAGLRQGYRSKDLPMEAAELKQALAERFATREQNDVGRVRQVVALAGERGCLVRHLLGHFGEELGRDCGHCGNCLREQPRPFVLDRPESPLTLNAHALGALRAEHPQGLATARQIARLLCGLTSPRLTAAKLSRHPLFGSLAETPFQRVLQAAERL